MPFAPTVIWHQDADLGATAVTLSDGAERFLVLFEAGYAYDRILYKWDTREMVVASTFFGPKEGVTIKRSEDGAHIIRDYYVIPEASREIWIRRIWTYDTSYRHDQVIVEFRKWLGGELKIRVARSANCSLALLAALAYMVRAARRRDTHAGGERTCAR